MLDKAEYSAFESTLNSPIVSYRIVSHIPETETLKQFRRVEKYANEAETVSVFYFSFILTCETGLIINKVQLSDTIFHLDIIGYI